MANWRSGDNKKVLTNHSFGLKVKSPAPNQRDWTQALLLALTLLLRPRQGKEYSWHDQGLNRERKWNADETWWNFRIMSINKYQQNRHHQLLSTTMCLEVTEASANRTLTMSPSLLLASSDLIICGCVRLSSNMETSPKGEIYSYKVIRKLT